MCPIPELMECEYRLLVPEPASSSSSPLGLDPGRNTSLLVLLVLLILLLLLHELLQQLLLRPGGHERLCQLQG